MSLSKRLTIGVIAILAIGCSTRIPVLQLNIPNADFRSFGDPEATDRGAIGTSFLSYSGNKSFSDYRMTGRSNQALLVGSFYDSANFRGMGRHFWKDTGWASFGTQYANIDSGAADIVHTAAAIDVNGNILALTSDGSTTAKSQTTYFQETWGSLTTAFMQPSTSIPKATHPNNGYSSAMVYSEDLDRTYLALINVDTAATSPDNNLYLQYYGTSWAGSGEEILLAADASQTDMVYDGLGTTTVWLTEAAVTPHVGLGTNHKCYLRRDSSVKCVGTNSSGQLGDATTINRTLPVYASGLDVTSGEMITSIDAQGNHSCALTSAGAVRCWGEDDNGEVGDSQTCSGGTNCTTPTVVTGIDGSAESAEAIAVGGHHACVAVTSGDGGGFRCWGENGNGQLGDGTTTDATAPVAAVNAGTNYAAMSAGDAHSCAMISGGNVVCWGNNAEGELGDNQACGAGNCTSPAAAVVAGATAIASGAKHTCALDAGTLKCWGDNAYGQAGDGNGNNDNLTEVNVSGLTSLTVSQIAAGDNHTCVIYSGGSTTGGVKCWGRNDQGQLGIGITNGPDTTNCTGSTACSTTPVDVAPFGSGITAVGIGAGGDETCVQTTERGTYCWGDGNSTPSQNLEADDCPSGVCVMAAWSLDNTFTDRSVVSGFGSTAQAFSMATDGNGTMVVVYIQDSVGHPSCSTATTPTTTNCEYRVYASVRSPLGVWTGPTRIDSDFDDRKTSLYQLGGTANVGGIDYPTPQVAFAGDGVFKVVFPMINLDSRTGGIYAKTYDMNSGWGAGLEIIQTESLQGSEQYRMVNDLRLLGSGAGRLIMMANYVTTNGAAVANREYGYKLYDWNSGIWVRQKELDGRYSCAANNANCVNPKIDGHLFGTGQGVFIFPAPASDGSADFRLWSIRYE